MPRFLPDKERPAKQLRVGDELYLLRDSAWHRIVKTVELYSSVQFVLDNGGEFYAEYGQRVRSRSAPD